MRALAAAAALPWLVVPCSCGRPGKAAGRGPGQQARARHAARSVRLQWPPAGSAPIATRERPGRAPAAPRTAVDDVGRDETKRLVGGDGETRDLKAACSALAALEMLNYCQLPRAAAEERWRVAFGFCPLRAEHGCV